MTTLLQSNHTEESQRHVIKLNDLLPTKTHNNQYDTATLLSLRSPYPQPPATILPRSAPIAHIQSMHADSTTLPSDSAGSKRSARCSRTGRRIQTRQTALHSKNSGIHQTQLVEPGRLQQASWECPDLVSVSFPLGLRLAVAEAK